MPSSRAVRAGAAYVELYANDKRLARGLKRAQKRLAAFGAFARDIGLKLAMVTAVLAAPFAIGTKIYADFEEQLANVATMLDRPEEHLPRFKQALRDMAVEFGESTEALAGGLYDILSASIPAGKALDVLAVSAKAAKAGITDTKTAADAITTILNSYGMSADRAAEVSDALFQVVKRGKCVTGDTRVLLADGQYRRIDSLSGNVEVISWDGRNFTPAKARWVDMGTKRTVKVRTSFGREVVTTPEHPYLTPSGWKPIQELKAGDRIALPVSLSVWGNKEAPPGWPTLLGYLIAEGSIQDASPRVTTSLDSVVADLRRSADLLGVQVHKVNQADKSKCPMYDLVAGRRGGRNTNLIIEKLREAGLWGKSCREKFVPDECFRWRKQDIVELLRALFTGDGWLSRTRCGFQLGYCSTSKRLVEDVSHLLLRFGIVLRVKKTLQGAWTLTTRRYVDIRRFVDFIGLERDSVREFKDFLPRRSRAALGRRHWTDGAKHLSAKDSLFKPLRGVRNFHQPIFFDKIVAKEDGPVERVYDLTVPILHNFVANDIVAHNTTFAELAPSIGLVASTAASAGVGLDELGAGLATLTRNGVRTENAVTAVNAIISTFLKPTGEARDYARELGFEMSSVTLQAEGLEGVFKRISHLPPDAIAKLFPNKRALRGVIPALKNMEGFSEDVALMRASAGATETAYAKMTKTLAHAFRQLKQSAMAALSVLGEAIAEPLSRAAKAVAHYAGRLRDLFEKNKALILVAAKVVAMLGLVAAGFLALGAAGALMAFVFGGIAAIFNGVAVAVGLVGSVIAALVSPIGIAITAMVALGAYILHATGAGAKALSWLSDRFQGLKKTAVAAWTGIGDALAAGDIALAAKVLWLMLKMEWKRGINWLNGLWVGFKESFLSLATDAFYGAVYLLNEAWSGLQIAWIETTSFLGKAWTRFTSLVARTWNKVQGWLAKRWVEIASMMGDEIDVEATQRYIDERTGARDRELEADAKKTLAEREARRREKREEIDREREGVLDAVLQAAEAEKKARRERYAGELSASEKALGEARKEWKDAIARASYARAEAEEAELPSADQPTFEAPGIVDELKNKLQQIGTGLDAAARAVEVRGTFNPAALRGLAVGSVAERTAKAAEETARNTRKLLDEARENGLAFA